MRLAVPASLLLVASLAGGRAHASREADRRAEAEAQLGAILGGANVPGATARLRFLGEEGYAAGRLCQQADAPDAQVRRAVAAALEGLAAPGSEECLGALARDEDGATRMSAVRGLRAVHSRAAGLVLPLLRDKTLGVRREAALTLGAMRLPRLGAALLRAARVEEEPDVRVALLVAVGQSGDARQVRPLQSFLQSSSESTRLAAAQGLCLLGARAGFDFVRGRLSAPDVDARSEALLLLAGVPARRAAPLLLPLLQDHDLHVAARAARLLYEGGDRRMADWLVLASARAAGAQKEIVEQELDHLQLTDEERQAILKRARP